MHTFAAFSTEQATMEHPMIFQVPSETITIVAATAFSQQIHMICNKSKNTLGMECTLRFCSLLTNLSPINIKIPGKMLKQGQAIKS